MGQLLFCGAETVGCPFMAWPFLPWYSGKRRLDETMPCQRRPIGRGASFAVSLSHKPIFITLPKSSFMKRIFFLMLLFMEQMALAQGYAVPVPGMKYRILLPKGFVLETSFGGFHDAETGASIMVIELPASYQTIVEGFTEEALLSRGMSLIAKNAIRFSDTLATWLSVTQTANGQLYHKQMLLFGDGHHTIIGNGVYPAEAQALEPTIKAALLSLQYDENLKADPFEVVPFQVDLRQTNFRFQKYSLGNLIYTADGNKPAESSIFVVGSWNATLAPESRKTFAIQQIRKLSGVENSDAVTVKEVLIDGLSGYEMIVLDKAETEKLRLSYQIILFEEDGKLYWMIGQTSQDIPKYTTLYQQIAQTFKRK